MKDKENVKKKIFFKLNFVFYNLVAFIFFKNKIRFGKKFLGCLFWIYNYFYFVRFVDREIGVVWEWWKGFWKWWKVIKVKILIKDECL